MTTEMTMRDRDISALGAGMIDDDRFDALVARSLGVDRAVVTQARVSTVDYPTDTIATAALHRVHGQAMLPTGQSKPFSIFVKLLRSARAWPFIEVVPEALRQRWIDEFPWRLEIDAYNCPIADVLPSGMRLADLYEVVEIDADHAAIWMEDVQVDPSRPWSPDDYLRAARGLGQLAGRRPLGSDTALGIPSNHAPALALKEYAQGRIAHAAIPAVLADETWESRRLARADLGDLQRRLRRLTGALGEMLNRLDALPHLYPHGDASPQNLLIPVDEPDTFVVIDWGFNSPQAVGFDLGQLLLGLANNDELPIDEMARLEPLVIEAYTEGLASVGVDVTSAQVREGYALSMAVRSMFTALGLDEGPAGDDWTDEHRDNRVAMTLHLLSLSEEYV